MNKHICDRCGCVYDPEQGDPSDGVKAGAPFDALPEDWGFAPSAV